LRMSHSIKCYIKDHEDDQDWKTNKEGCFDRDEGWEVYEYCYCSTDFCNSVRDYSCSFFIIILIIFS
ncbi:hypothetical protein PFISCL1PPCAC_28386, partial [Pristionchus fissidentatus]